MGAVSLAPHRADISVTGAAQIRCRQNKPEKSSTGEHRRSAHDKRCAAGLEHQATLPPVGESYRNVGKAALSANGWGSFFIRPAQSKLGHKPCHT